MRISMVVAFVLLFLVSPGETAAVEEINFLPPTFFVGDLVEMRILLSAPLETLSIPSTLPTSDWFNFRDIALFEHQEGSEVRISFSSFQPGLRMMPPLDLGGMIIADVRVNTASLLEAEATEFAPPEEPLYLQGTGLFLGVALGLLIGSPVAIVLLVRVVRRAVVASSINRNRREAYDRVSGRLRELHKQILGRNIKQYYATIIDEIKLYLSRRTGQDISSQTGRELCATLGRVYCDEVFVEPLKRLILYSDDVKYGGRKANLGQRRLDLATAEDLISQLEEHHSSLWRGASREGK